MKSVLLAYVESSPLPTGNRAYIFLWGNINSYLSLCDTDRNSDLNTNHNISLLGHIWFREGHASQANQ